MISPHLSTALERNLRAAFARAYVRIVGSLREPSWILWESVLPIFTLSGYVYVYRYMETPQEFTGFIILGGVVAAFWLNVLWNMASQLYWEKETGNLEPLLIAPISRMAILLGMAAGGIFNTALRALVIVIVGTLVFKVGFVLVNPGLAALIFVLTLCAMYLLGMTFASVFLMYGREAWHMSHLLQEPVFFLSGLYYPIRYLPYWLQLAASAIPLSFGMDAIRQVLLQGAGFEQVKIHLLALSLFSLLFLGLATYSLRHMEDLSRRDGRLTMRWQ